MNELALKSKPRSFRRLLPLAIALLLAALVAIPASNFALAQSPPGDAIALVNEDRNLVERKKGGEFVARPVFDREIETLFYAVRDADIGDWISAMYRVQGGEKKRSDGWEYSFEYPAWTTTPTSTPTGPTCWSCWRPPKAVSGGTSTRSSPSTSRAASGTRFCPPSTPDAGREPLPAG